MQLDIALFRTILSKDLMDVMIRVGLIVFLVLMAVKIFAPFMGLMLWALILAVTLYPLHLRIVKRLGGRQGLAATLLVIAGLFLIGGPITVLGSSFADYLIGLHTTFENNTITIPQPDAAVAGWPLIGDKLYALWGQAANDLPELLAKAKPQLETAFKLLLEFVASMAGGAFSFMGSMIVAGIMMAYGESGSVAMRRILSRLAGPNKGPGLHALSTATIRSVAMGVIGVAFIQAVLLGAGFIWADIPAAGVLAFIVLIFGIAQVPAAIVTLPVIIYIWWSGDSTGDNIMYTVYLVVAGMADNVLKPLLLGRGVDAPMPIILLGALGGMVASGIIGLFIGSVLLALAYQIFMDWVADGESVDAAQDDLQAPDETSQASLASD
jgi:predicted PurR-regulated permease PerM